eukprot:scaffold2642_cov120-Cylindrotheca_fusiformis.AAC.1
MIASAVYETPILKRRSPRSSDAGSPPSPPKKQRVVREASFDERICLPLLNELEMAGNNSQLPMLAPRMSLRHQTRKNSSRRSLKLGGTSAQLPFPEGSSGSNSDYAEYAFCA